LPYLAGSQQQLDPEVDRAFAVDAHSSAVMAAGPLEAKII
jgi:hypothetical protein